MAGAGAGGGWLCQVSRAVDLLVHYLRRVHYFSYYKCVWRKQTSSTQGGWEGTQPLLLELK